MKNGYKVADMDTHVLPSMETLEQYMDPSFKPRVPELQPYRRSRIGGESEGTSLFIRMINLDRMIGEVPPGWDITVPDGPAGNVRAVGEGRTAGHHRVKPQPRVSHENSLGRIQDMDLEGRDLDLLYPGNWANGMIAFEDVTLGEGVWHAYHRYAKDYCSVAPDRLKSMALLPGTDLEWSMTELKSIANEEWLSAVWLVLPEDMPYDHPDLEPMWALMNDLDLPLVIHMFPYNPPYFPGYRDIWGNAAIARAAAPHWAASRYSAYLICSGVFDRYPNFRAGVAEVGHGWVPHWLIRLGEQMAYVSGTMAPIKYKPTEYAQMGRFMCPAEPMEGPEITRATLELLGDGCLTHQSDYPHGEAFFPDTAGMVIDWPIWEKLGGDYLRKYMWDNGERFLRMS